MNPPFQPGDRTYYVSDERLRAFKALTAEEKLRWMEEVSTFLRMAKIGSAQAQAGAHQQTPPRDTPSA
jgi:hypothetical protein